MLEKQDVLLRLCASRRSALASAAGLAARATECADRRRARSATSISASRSLRRRELYAALRKDDRRRASGGPVELATGAASGRGPSSTSACSTRRRIVSQPPTAKLTPEYQACSTTSSRRSRRATSTTGSSRCDPPGHPRWLVEPFLREFVVTPDQTWLIDEVANEIRRVYTDGREHLAEGDRFPTWDGDSIGFWHDGKLVIHTNQLSAGQYTRGQPDHSEQAETVEICAAGRPGRHRRRRLGVRRAGAHRAVVRPAVLPTACRTTTSCYESTTGIVSRIEQRRGRDRQGRNRL